MISLNLNDLVDAQACIDTAVIQLNRAAEILGDVARKERAIQERVDELVLICVPLIRPSIEEKLKGVQ